MTTNTNEPILLPSPSVTTKQTLRYSTHTTITFATLTKALTTTADIVVRAEVVVVCYWWWCDITLVMVEVAVVGYCTVVAMVGDSDIVIVEVVATASFKMYHL